MLQDLDQTLENLVRREGKLNKSDIDVAFEQPTSEWSARLSRPTLNCFCYDLRENLKLRTMERNVTYNGNQGHLSFPPRRMDLSYLITAWARKVEDEHQLLWRALASFKKYKDLMPSECEGALRYQTRNLPMTVAVMGENPLNLADLWGVLDNQMRLGFVLSITVELDTEIGFDAPLVLEADIRVGRKYESEQEMRNPELTGEYVRMKHTGDRELFDETGEKKITTHYSDEVVDPSHDDDEERG